MKKTERNSSFAVAAGHRNLETMAHVHREPNGSRAAHSYPIPQTKLNSNNCTVNSQNLQNGQLTRHSTVIRGNNEKGELREYPRRPPSFYVNYCPRCLFLDPSVELRRIQLERDYKNQNMKETLKVREEIETDNISITQLRSAGEQNGAFVLEESDHNFQLVPLNNHNRGNGLGKALVRNVSAFQTSNEISKDKETQTPEKRETSWVSEYDMYVSTITYMIGLGNVLRFSKLCLDNGGGAFLIPYIIMLVFAGIPLVCLEMSVGQRAGYRSPLKSWRSLEPNLKWIGFASFMNLLICTFYYCLMVTWCFYYLCFSLTSSLPWNECALFTEKVNNSRTVDAECEANPAAYFWFRNTLDISDDLSHSHDFNGKLYGFILVSWTIVWLLVMKGIKASSRALYILLLLIIVLLVAFFFAGVRLEGWAQGLAVFFIPQVYVTKTKQLSMAANIQAGYH